MPLRSIRLHPSSDRRAVRICFGGPSAFFLKVCLFQSCHLSLPLFLLVYDDHSDWLFGGRIDGSFGPVVQAEFIIAAQLTGGTRQVGVDVCGEGGGADADGREM